jgi:hypothetical protein
VALRVSSCSGVFERENTGSKRERERERCGERAHTPELNEEQMSPFLKALEKFGEEDEHNNRESHLSTQHIQNAFKRTEEVWAEANDPHRKKGWHCTRYIVCSKQHWKSLVTPPSNQRRKRYPCADYTVHTQPQRKSWVHCHLLWCPEIVDFHGVFS